MATLYTPLVDGVAGTAAIFNTAFQELEDGFLANPGAWAPITAWTTLGSDQASITIGSISGSYKALLLRLLARSTVVATTDTLLIQPNADTTAGNMYTRRVQWDTTTTLAVQTGAGTGLDLGSILPGASALADHYAPVDFYLFNYASASLPKQFMYDGYTHTADAAANMARHFGGGVWKGTAAVTSLKFLPGTGSLATGSSYALYRLS